MVVGLITVVAGAVLTGAVVVVVGLLLRRSHPTHRTLKHFQRRLKAIEMDVLEQRRSLNRAWLSINEVIKRDSD